MRTRTKALGSVRIGDPRKFEVNGEEQDDLSQLKILYERTPSGALNPEKKVKTLDQLRVIDGVVYGLVNVRTDGNKIICATLNEGKYKWEIKEFLSRF